MHRQTRKLPRNQKVGLAKILALTLSRQWSCHRSQDMV